MDSGDVNVATISLRSHYAIVRGGNSEDGLPLSQSKISRKGAKAPPSKMWHTCFMTDVKQAVAIAMTYFRTLMDDKGLSDILLEEVELSDDERYWNVTLSALLPASNEEPVYEFNSIAQALGQQPQRRRVYKVFKINAERATVQSMKIRQAS